jgi:hypothetical protein
MVAREVATVAHCLLFLFLMARRDSAPKSRRNDGTRASDGASPHLVILVGQSRDIILTVE